MSSFGVTLQGFVDKPLEDIKAEVAARLRTELGAELDLSAESAIGVIYQIFCEQLRQMWELQQAVYSAQDPDAAEGMALDILAALTATRRRAATRSTVSIKVTTDQAVSVDAGDFVVSVDGNAAARFRNAEAIVTAGAESIYVLFEAEDTGPIVANQNTLTVIETPVSGITAVVNDTADADIGTNIEGDEDLRARREDELRATGAGTFDAMRADLLTLTGVRAVRIFENATPATVDGLPPHSFEACVLGGADQDVVDQIWESKPLGILAHGSESGTALDSEGTPHDVGYTRPTELAVYVAVEVEVDPDEYPDDGDTRIATAVALHAQQRYSIGTDVIVSALYPVIFGIPGVTDVTAVFVDFAPAPSTSANLSVGAREIATIDTGDISVVSA